MATIVDPSQCQLVRLPEQHDSPAKDITKLIYIHSGKSILALCSDGVHIVWDVDDDEPDTASFRPWKPSIRKTMVNEVVNPTFPDAVISCFSVFKDDNGGFLASGSGRSITLYDMETHEAVGSFMITHLAAPTSIVFHPQDRNIVILGMEDASIVVYTIRRAEILAIRIGHSKRVTGLAVTDSGDLFVSTDAHAKICLWSFKGCSYQTSEILKSPQGTPSPPSNTLVEFHRNQTSVLVVHKLQLAQYTTRQLARLNQWHVTSRLPCISHATYSCDSQLVYASFMDGTIAIFYAAGLVPKSRIDSRAYLPSRSVSNLRSVVVAAHPKRPNQIAVGVANDGVYVLEPNESQGQWGGSRGGPVRANKGPIR